jgi:hypothetical protein
VHAVIEINVHMAVPEKQRMVARRRTAKMMACRIARWIALRFHNPAAEPSFGQFMDNNLADEKPRQLQRVAGKLFSGQAANFEGRTLHGYDELTSGGSLLKSRASSAWSITTAGSS